MPRHRRSSVVPGPGVVVVLVLVSLGLAAWVRLPVHWRRQLLRNESIAIGTMKRMGSAMQQFHWAWYEGPKDRGVAWKPPDFEALAAQDLLEPAKTGHLHSPILLEANGYLFELWSSAEDPALWFCYAWPSAHGWTGNRILFTNQAGDVYVSGNHPNRYSGLSHRPDPTRTAFKRQVTGPESPDARPVLHSGSDDGVSMVGLRWTII